MTQNPLISDRWDDGSAYERYVGRWSRLVAPKFLDWLDVPAGSAWLDFGCGTGALTQTILTERDPRLVVGCDRSAGFIGFAKERIRDDRARFAVAALPELPQTEGGFDVIVAALVLNFLPAPAEGLAAMIRRARSGAVLGAYVWDYLDGMELIRLFWDTVIDLDPGARSLDEAVRFPWCRAEPLRLLFESSGLKDVEVRSIEVPTVFRDFDDYWTPFLGGQGPAPAYLGSLDSERRIALREAIRPRLPTAPDGTIRLTARAWGVKGMTA